MSRIDSTPPKILVVDDSEIVLEVTRMYLEVAGLEVVTLDNAVRLDAAVAEERPDLVLLDVKMPGLRGTEAALLLRVVDRAATPILLYSDLEEEELAEFAREIGASGYIKKTEDELKLIAQVRQYLEALRPAEGSK